MFTIVLKTDKIYRRPTRARSKSDDLYGTKCISSRRAFRRLSMDPIIIVIIIIDRDDRPTVTREPTGAVRGE